MSLSLFIMSDGTAGNPYQLDGGKGSNRQEEEGHRYQRGQISFVVV